MEEMRAAAKAYYAHMSDSQHESFQSFYGLMDKSGDGRVSNYEFSAFIREQGYNYVPSNLFGLLDKKNTGYLDYEECITFFYMLNCNRFVFCDRCRSFLVGLHFVCVECYSVGRETYNLCCSCYQNNNYNHPHSYFLDNYDLLHTKPWEVQRLRTTFATMAISQGGNVHPNKVNASGAGGGSLYKRAMMTDLVTTARLYYNKSSEDVQKSAHDFFDSFDSNKNGKVSRHEFLWRMRELGHVKMGSSHFFEELDNDRNGTLEFMELMALYYIIKSGRPFCSGCHEFIPSMYFSCSICFENGNNLFCVCPSCFQGGKFNHDHHQFLDNFALLEAKRIQYKPNSSVTFAELEEYPTSTANAHVPHEKPTSQRCKIALKVLEAALGGAFSGVAGIAATAAVQSMSCTIM